MLRVFQPWSPELAGYRTQLELCNLTMSCQGFICSEIPEKLVWSLNAFGSIGDAKPQPFSSDRVAAISL